MNGTNGESNGDAGKDSTDPIRDFAQMSLPLNEEIASALVERCGDKRYWKRWGDDVAEVANRIRNRIETLIDRPDRPATREAFNRFLGEMKQTINKHLQPEQLVGMLASHLVTLPVFEALFGSTEFAHRNPVVKALTDMTNALDDEGLLNEARELDHFYQSVKISVQDVTDPDGRLRILLDLYETFFKKADPKEAARSGIAYTPIEIVDFILRSADAVARQEFGKGLSDENVHILDPFTGTGTFINRILALPDLIADDDLPRKYASELHANELLLLPYYIAAVKIEQGYISRRPDDDYQPFEGIVLADTFELNSDQPTMPTMSGNSERAQRQADLPIQVIVGNPPWSAGQKSAGEDNPNVPHKHLKDRISETYATRSDAQLSRFLHNLYKMSIRWATDRIGERGIVAFVTPNSFLDGNAESGMRACLADEFTTIHVFDLRGAVQQAAWRREGGKMFDSRSTVGTAITVMVRNPDKTQSGCRIFYRDIGDYLTTQEKRQMLVDLGSMEGIDDWQTITPNEDHDWISQGDPTWERLLPLGTKNAKTPKATPPDTIFGTCSPGFVTARDAYLYSFDDLALAGQVEKMIRFYEKRREAVATGKLSFVEATRNDSLHVITWTDTLKRKIKQNRIARFDAQHMRFASYRPFVKRWVHFDPLYIERPGGIPEIFPLRIASDQASIGLETLPITALTTGQESNGTNLVSWNQVIYITGKGASVEFSTLITDTTPDYHFLSGGQAFPRYNYSSMSSGSKGISGKEPLGSRHRVPRRSVHGRTSDVLPIHLHEDITVAHPQFLDMDDPANAPDAPDEHGRIDNITNWCLDQFQDHYNDTTVTKDDIWAYIYGVLHAPDWRIKYANDLRKGLPRIPFAPDFRAFQEAGQQLIDLHLNYETCPPWPLKVVTTGDTNNPDLYRINKKMAWVKKRNADGKLVKNTTVLVINDHCRIEGIPNEAHYYEVNGKTPLDWAIARLTVTTNKKSGITNDANKWQAWADEPYNLILHLQRLVRLSVESTRIVKGLPPALSD